MRHIVLFDPDTPAWMVVDAEAAHMVVSFHTTRREAALAAAREEESWPSRQPLKIANAA